MKKYEVMFIVKPTLSEEEVTAVFNKYKKVLTDNKASITGETDMVQRELAYEIKKLNEGYYVVLKFEAKPELITELERVYRIADEVIKFIVVKEEE